MSGQEMHYFFEDGEDTSMAAVLSEEGCQYEQGTYTLRIGTSVAELPLEVKTTLVLEG
ncbi:hypothetical protein [Arthrobacter sp. NA-172]|uniref:hypothetical protein n=1 Tax=Arthrobacter sp. NA-172 TaxID=3367524 RepID=UPI00375471A2